MFLQAAGLSGAAAVAIGAWGAHASVLKGANPIFVDVFKTASNYHFIHTGILLVSATQFHGKKRQWVCGLLLSGIILFSGSCYVVAIKQDRAYGKLAPFGGMSLIAGWLAIAFL